MADESVKCALWLRKEGMKLGDTVCVFTHNHLTTYIPCLATLFNRGILCPSFSGHTIGKYFEKEKKNPPLKYFFFNLKLINLIFNLNNFK